MKKIRCFFFVLIFLSIIEIAIADRGQIWPYPVRLNEESQKAIILHNQEEEILILGTELKAEREIGVLEFIPFPTEPVVSLAKDNPFQAIQELISQKQLQFKEMTKGGSGVSPVELKFSAKIGVHDVTVIKINDLEGFSKWVAGFFKKKGIAVKNNLNSVNMNADDYLKRGYHYFVFDYVLLNEEVKFIEPLIYRFRTDKLYYPLKTSNIIGGEGLVDLVLILPGSLGLWHDYNDIRKFGELFNAGNWDLSSSAKMYPEELQAIYPEAGDFFKNGKIYLQVLKFTGRYEFKDDLALDISNIAPYVYKQAIYIPDYDDYWGGGYELTVPFSPDEKKDIAEAYNRKRPEWIFTPEMMEAIGEFVNPEERSGK